MAGCIAPYVDWRSNLTYYISRILCLETLGLEEKNQREVKAARL